MNELSVFEMKYTHSPLLRFPANHCGFAIDAFSIINENYPVPEIVQAHFAQRQNEGTCSMEVDKHQAKRTTEKIDVDHLYLPKNSFDSNERAFVPKNGINLKPIALEIESLNKIKSDYISLDAIDGSSTHTTGFHKKSKKLFKTPLALYRDLTVHKIQNNPNKAKKQKNKSKNKANK